MQVTAAVLEEHHKPLNVQELEIDEPLAGEVLVKIVASGVCHTDAIAQEANFPFPLPGVLGHEGAGIVEAVGDGVTKVAQGDKVIIGWPWCGECRNCLAGRQRYCLQIGPLVGAGVRLSTGGTLPVARQRGGPRALLRAVVVLDVLDHDRARRREGRRRRADRAARPARAAAWRPARARSSTRCGPRRARSSRSSAPGRSASRRSWRPRCSGATSIIAIDVARPPPRRSPRSSARRTRSTRRRPIRSPRSARSPARARWAPTTRWSAPATSTCVRQSVDCLEHAGHRGAHRRRAGRRGVHARPPHDALGPHRPRHPRRRGPERASCSRRSSSCTRRAASRSTASCSSSSSTRSTRRWRPRRAATCSSRC